MRVLEWLSVEFHDTSGPNYRHMFGDITGYYVYLAVVEDGEVLFFTDQDGNMLGGNTFTNPTYRWPCMYNTY